MAQVQGIHSTGTENTSLSSSDPGKSHTNSRQTSGNGYVSQADLTRDGNSGHYNMYDLLQLGMGPSVRSMPTVWWTQAWSQTEILSGRGTIRPRIPEDLL